MKPNQRIARRHSSRYACLNCRRVYKKSVWYTRSPHHISPRMAAYIAQAEAEGLPGRAKQWRRDAELKALTKKFACPLCGELLVDVGPHFKAPRKNHHKAWQRIRQFLLEQQRPLLSTMTDDEILRQRGHGQTQEDLQKSRHKPVVRMQDTEIVYKVEPVSDWKRPGYQ